jgi:hypothetical protein
VNASWPPTFKLAGVAGATVIEDNFAVTMEDVVVVLEEQPAMTKIKTAAAPKDKHLNKNLIRLFFMLFFSFFKCHIVKVYHKCHFMYPLL